MGIFLFLWDFVEKKNQVIEYERICLYRHVHGISLLTKIATEAVTYGKFYRGAT